MGRGAAVFVVGGGTCDAPRSDMESAPTSREAEV